MRKSLITTQQAWGTGWEPGVLGGGDKVRENEQIYKTNHYPNLTQLYLTSLTWLTHHNSNDSFHKKNPPV